MEIINEEIGKRVIRKFQKVLTAAILHDAFCHVALLLAMTKAGRLPIACASGIYIFLYSLGVKPVCFLKIL